MIQRSLMPDRLCPLVDLTVIFSLQCGASAEFAVIDLLCICSTWCIPDNGLQKHIQDSEYQEAGSLGLHEQRSSLQ